MDAVCVQFYQLLEQEIKYNIRIVMTDNQEEFTSITNFIPLQKIGEGSFSSVYKVKRVADAQVYALKKVKIGSLKDKQKQNALNEVRILASINSPYIISYKQAFFDDSLNILCIVMELASNHLQTQEDQGDLFQKIQSYRKKLNYIPERQIWKAINHITSGLEALHSKSILHRDLKSANIFLSGDYYKLGDLNVSKVQTSQGHLAYTQTGTPYYASPEIWKDQPYDYKSDIWSLGCLIYQICCFKTPFRGKNMDQLFKSVMNASYQEIPPIYSRQLRKLIAMCLRKNPKERPSIKELLSDRGIIADQCLLQNIHLGFRSSYNNIDNDSILKTIKLPCNLKMLKRKLPKSKYQPLNDSNSIKKYSFIQSRIDSSRNQRKKAVNSMEVNSISSNNMEESSKQKIQHKKIGKIKRSIKGIKIIKSITQAHLKEQKAFEKQLNSNHAQQLKNIQQQTKQLYNKIESLNFLSKIKTEKSLSRNMPVIKIETNEKDTFAEITKKLSENRKEKQKLSLIRQFQTKKNEQTSKDKQQPRFLIKKSNEEQCLSNKDLADVYYNFDSKNKVKLNSLQHQLSKVSSTPYIGNIDLIPFKRVLEVRRDLAQFKKKVEVFNRKK